MPMTTNNLNATKAISGRNNPVRNLKIMTMILASLSVLIFMIDCAGRPPLNDSNQLVIVVTPSWEASHGILYCFARNDSKCAWQSVNKPIPIILGRNGMGWGCGLYSSSWSIGPRKTEGDGRSPAGVFKLGDAFGFPTADELPDLKIPYRPVSDILECIDDINSQNYAELIEREAGMEVDWQSSEKIIESPRAYYLSVIIEYNTEKPIKGAGSCIFLHCWTAPDDSTAGCTTLDRPEMENLVRWLDSNSHPVIVQLPLPVYRHFKNQWQLPRIE